MRKLSNRVIAYLLCLMCVLTLFPVQAFAASAIEPNKDVHLTIEYKHNNAPVAGVPFDLYYVASVDAYAQFTLAGDFQKYPVSFEKLDAEGWRSLARTLTAYADRDKLKPLDSGKTDAKGMLDFPNQQKSLKTGLYLAVGRKLVKDGYTYTTEPFLISLPNLDQKTDTWTYRVTAAPKNTRTQNPSTSDKPSSSTDKTVERKVLKVWKKDVPQTRPKEVTIQLLKDGAVYDTVTLNEANHWRHSWKKLPETDKDGSKIVWNVAEKEVNNYTVLVSKEGSTFTVTNTYSPKEPTGKLVTRTVVKTWDDRGYESRRPKSVRVTLLQNDTSYATQTLSAENSWQYTWDKLPRYDKNGAEFVWTIREEAVSGYTPSVRLNGTTFVLTNSVAKQKLPQTGVLWWPVPILIVAGLLFLIAGTLARRKEHHE